MVEVKYLSRLGNNLFQYCFGRIITEGLGYKLKADPIPGFPNTNVKVDGCDYSSGYPIQVIAQDYPEWYDGDYSQVFSWRNKNLSLDSVLKDNSKRKIIIEGYFQRYEYYKKYKDIIKKDWLALDPSTKKENQNSNDIIVCVRRTDYIRTGNALPFSYYREALNMEKHDRVFILSDDANDPFINLFKKYNAVVYKESNPLEQFRFIMSFNKIIISTSTFYWWASFLSNAQEIYYPLPLQGFWSKKTPEIDLRVNDEKRYIYINCKEIYKRSLTEKIIRCRRTIQNMKKHCCESFNINGQYNDY